MLLMTLAALAQSTLPMSSWDYAGVIDADGKGFVTMELVKNTMNKQVRFAGEDLAWGDPILVEARMAVDLRDATASGDKRYVWVAADKAGVLLQLDAAGKELARKTFEMPNHRQNDAALYPTGDGGVIVVTQNKAKKVGKVVDVERLDAGLATAWTKRFQVEKKGLKLLDSAASDAGVVVLARGMDKAVEVIALGLDGSETHRTTLDGGDRSLEGMAVALADDGTAAVFGSWAHTGTVRETDKPGQYFFAVVDPSGSATVETSTWDMGALAVTRTGATNTDAKLHVNDLVATADGFRLVGETYTWTGDTVQLMGAGATNQTQVTPFDVYDVALVDVGRDAKVTTLRRLHQPTKRTAIRAVASGIDQTLVRYGRLGLRDVTADRLLMAHDDHNVVTVSCVDPAADHVGFDVRQWVGVHTDDAAGAQGARWAAVYSLGVNDDENGNRTLTDTDVLPHADGGFVVAHLSDGTLSLERRSCDAARDDGLIQGLGRLERAFDTFPGGGAYALYAREAAEDGHERYAVVVDDGRKVHRASFTAPSSQVARVENASSVLHVTRADSVHHLTHIDRTAGIRTATLDLAGDDVTGAVYAGAGDTFVVATTFRTDAGDRYAVNWLDGDLSFTASSSDVTGPGRLSLRALGGTDAFVAFEESWRQENGDVERIVRVFDRAGASVKELPHRGRAQWGTTLFGGGLRATSWGDGVVSVDALDPSRAPLVLDGPALASALGWDGLAGALADGTLRLRTVDLATVGDRTFLVGELLKGANADDDQAGFGTDLVVLELTTSGAVAVRKGTVVPVEPAATRNRYRGLVPRGEDVEVVFLDLQQGQWVAAAATLSAPLDRRYAPTALGPLVETEPSSGPTLAFVEKLERMAASYERGAKRLEALLGATPPASPPAVDPATRVIPLGEGQVRVVHHRPDWRIAQWETFTLR
jgi:hypothetical protein